MAQYSYPILDNIICLLIPDFGYSVTCIWLMNLSNKTMMFSMICLFTTQYIWNHYSGNISVIYLFYCVLWTIPFVRWYWPIYPVDHFPLHGFSWRVSDDLFFYPYSIRQYYLSSDTCCLHNFIGHSLAPADHINLTQSVKSLRACCSTVVWESRVFLSLMFAYFQLCRENLYHFELVT